jgi:formate hydrogenlyase subunit 4
MNRETGRVNIPEKKNWGARIFVIAMILGIIALYIALDRAPEKTPVEPAATEQTVQ